MKSKHNKKFISPRMIITVILLLSTLLTSISILKGTANALVANPAATAKISFTFDDSLQSASTQAQPILAKYGLTGTDYVITGCVGMTAIPNTCRANNDASYMTWAQIKQLQAAGWEIGSHTVTHPYLATKDATDGQPNVLTQAQVVSELTQSKAALAAQGITANAFSTPYGDYNPTTLAQIAKLYTSHRGFADQNDNVWPYSDYLLNDYQVQAGVTVAQVEAKIDAAIAKKTWLILTMHDILPIPSTNPDDYQYGTILLDQIAAYVKAKQTAGLIAPVNVSQGLVTSNSNMLANSSFDSVDANGWTTDAPATIFKDIAGNGSMPSPTNSVKLSAIAAKNTHLFSPKVTVDSNTTYLLKNFLNVSAITGNAVGFYIDEYDAAGNWISGQYKVGEPSKFVEELNFSYKPTSIFVKTARLQVIAPANSGAVAYLDNIQWFALSATTPPVQTNLVANGAFDSGIASGWTTNSPTTIKADTGSHGSPNNPVNSVHLQSTANNVYLFSPKVTVDPTKNYTIQSYLDLQQVANGGEVGFYIDEYDTNGNWISGQYKTGIRSISKGDVGVAYKPSSTTVKSASLQIIVTGNSNISAYYDDVRWYLAS